MRHTVPINNTSTIPEGPLLVNEAERLIRLLQDKKNMLHKASPAAIPCKLDEDNSGGHAKAFDHGSEGLSSRASATTRSRTTLGSSPSMSSGLLGDQLSLSARDVRDIPRQAVGRPVAAIAHQHREAQMPGFCGLVSSGSLPAVPGHMLATEAIGTAALPDGNPPEVCMATRLGSPRGSTNSGPSTRHKANSPRCSPTSRRNMAWQSQGGPVFGNQCELTGSVAHGSRENAGKTPSPRSSQVPLSQQASQVHQHRMSLASVSASKANAGTLASTPSAAAVFQGNHVATIPQPTAWRGWPSVIMRSRSLTQVEQHPP